MLVTGLLVARPVVLGEDPGLLDDLSDAGGLVLTLLGLVAALGWAAWRLLAKKGDWYGGVVEAALLALVVLVFVSAESAARYKHPARLIAWEWLGLFLTFLVVRQLAARPDDGHALYAVLLAGAVSLSAYTVYQAAFELPRDQQRYADREALRKDMVRQHVYLDDAQLEMMYRRLQDRHAFGTFAHPNSCAGHLALLLPGLVGAAVACRRHGWLLTGAVACALVGLVALWLTHSRGALLALAVVGVGAAAVAWRRYLWSHKAVALTAVLALAAVGFVAARTGLFASGLGKSTATAGFRLDYWSATWEMIRRHPWLGVGPGNFGGAYPRYMAATAGETIRDPHNFALELWATCGAFALLALLVALAAFFVQTGRAWSSFSREPAASAPPPPDALASGSRLNEPVRWEYYLGGMLGLLLGFVLRVQEAPAAAILPEAINAGLRSVVWFAAFALFERVPWTERGRAAALSAGVAALLLNLCVSGGISFPSVAGPLWVCVALALAAARPAPAAWLSRQRWFLTFPVPVLAGALLIYFVYVFFPVTSAATATRRALADGLLFFEQMDKPENERDIKQPAAFVQAYVLGQLQKAVEDDPDNARTHVLLAGWYGRVYRIFAPHDDRYGQRAIAEVRTAERLDPDGLGGYLAEYQLRLDFIQFMREVAKKQPERAPKIEEDSKKQYRLAADALLRYLITHPTDAKLHYRVAEALLDAGDDKLGRQEAREALRLDRLAPEGPRRLTDPQREQIQKWLASGPGAPAG